MGRPNAKEIAEHVGKKEGERSRKPATMQKRLPATHLQYFVSPVFHSSRDWET